MAQTAPGLLLQERFEDIEHFCEVTRAWDLDFRQPRPGALGGGLMQAGDGSVLLTRATFGAGICQRGISPALGRTFAVHAGVAPVEWYGRRVDDELLVFHPGGEFHAASGPGFDVFTLSVPEAVLACRGEQLDIDLERVLDPAEFVIRAPRAVGTLRKQLTALARTLQHLPRQLAAGLLHDCLSEELPRALVSVLGSDGHRRVRPSGQLRAGALRRALDFIRDSGGAPVRMPELCAASHASERTLEYAFKERFGIGPKAYLLTHRLDGVRRALRDADPKMTSVTQIAVSWGFWHMGQFASDYRERFSELPSQTLRARPSDDAG